MNEKTLQNIKENIEERKPTYGGGVVVGVTLALVLSLTTKICNYSKESESITSLKDYIKEISPLVERLTENEVDAFSSALLSMKNKEAGRVQVSKMLNAIRTPARLRSYAEEMRLRLINVSGQLNQNFVVDYGICLFLLDAVIYSTTFLHDSNITYFQSESEEETKH